MNRQERFWSKEGPHTGVFRGPFWHFGVGFVACIEKWYRVIISAGLLSFAAYLRVEEGHVRAFEAILSAYVFYTGLVHFWFGVGKVYAGEGLLDVELAGLAI